MPSSSFLVLQLALWLLFLDRWPGSDSAAALPAFVAMPISAAARPLFVVCSFAPAVPSVEVVDSTTGAGAAFAQVLAGNVDSAGRQKRGQLLFAEVASERWPVLVVLGRVVLE